MRRTTVAGIVALLLGLGVLALADAPAIDSGYRQVNDPPMPDDRAVVFWPFEQNPAQEMANPGKLQGNAEIVDSGRFGKALRLAGGGDAVVLAQIASLRGNERSIDFWLRFDRAPGQIQTVLAIVNREGKPALQLDLLPEGRLELEVEDIQPARTEPLPTGRWLHVALNDYFDPYPTQHPGVLSLRMAGVRLSVNGVEKATAAAPGGGPYHRGRRHGLPEARQLHRIVLGNNLAYNRGFVGLIDAFRLSNGPRYFYRPADQAWLKPDQTLPLERDPQFFQDPTAQVLYETFDRRTGTSIGHPPGVRSRAVLVEDHHGLRIDLPENLDLTGSTIEFWMRVSRVKDRSAGHFRVWREVQPVRRHSYWVFEAVCTNTSRFGPAVDMDARGAVQVTALKSPSHNPLLPP